MINHFDISLQLTNYEYKIYARHLILPEIQIQGQKRLKKSKVLFVGAGGLAASALLYLVASGVGHIGIMDDDKVEISNLQRQIIYNINDVGKYKTQSAAEHLSQLNPKCNLTIYVTKLHKKNAHQLIKLYDIIIDSTDNFRARYLLSYTCQILHKIHIYGAISSFQGQTSVFNYKGGPNYHEVYINSRPPEIGSCIVNGVLGVIPGIIGLIQATEAIKIITGIGETLSGYMLHYNALNMSFKKTTIRNNKRQTSAINSLLKYSKKRKEITNLISISELDARIKTNRKVIYLIDIRNIVEYEIMHLKHAINIPLSTIQNNKTLNLLRLISIDKYIVVYCNSYTKAQIASAILCQEQIKHWVVEIIK